MQTRAVNVPHYLLHVVCCYYCASFFFVAIGHNNENVVNKIHFCFEFLIHSLEILELHQNVFGEEMSIMNIFNVSFFKCEKNNNILAKYICYAFSYIMLVIQPLQATVLIIMYCGDNFLSLYSLCAVEVLHILYISADRVHHFISCM